MGTPRYIQYAKRYFCFVVLSVLLCACARSRPTETALVSTPRGSGTGSTLLFTPQEYVRSTARDEVVHERQRLWYGRRDALLGVR